MATTNDTENWYGRNVRDRTIFNPDFRVKPGRIEVQHAEWAEPYRGYVMVEPHIKATFSGDNKRWPWEYWQELVRQIPRPCIQCAKPGQPFLDGVRKVVTPTFAHAVAVLSVASVLVTTEGGLHHAAGALGIKAVVIFGAFNSPALFGYPFHENLAEPDPEGLGQRRTHPACVAAMRRITPDRVLEALCRL